MKVVLLCGGLGTRLSEETRLRPKPMVEIGHRPILWHIMNSYAHHNFKEFFLALGYKGDMIKEYFLNFYAHNNDICVDLEDGNVDYLKKSPKDWKVNLVDTGQHTLTGGRVLRLKDYLKDSTFMLTYGDGVADIDIEALVKFHKSHGKLATVTAVRPPSRFGVLQFDGDQVTDFLEKPQADQGWINGGYFIFEPKVLDYLKDDSTILERSPLESLAKEGQLMAYRHEGFWACMDTMRDKNHLNELYNSGKAPWVK